MQESTRKSQTKIDFLSKENSQLRNENLNLQKLIKLQHQKQEILEELKYIQCQFSQQQGPINSRLNNSFAKENLNQKQQCTCKEVHRTNTILSNLFNKTMIENKRLTALISTIQNERDLAFSKALIHEQIMEGLQLEEIDIIESLNEKILSLKSCITLQSGEINMLNKKLSDNGGNEKKIASNIIELEKVSQNQQPKEEKKTALRIVELNNLLEQSLDQLNYKNEKIKSLEDQKNELIIINSLLTAELQAIKTNQKENVNLSKIIHNQQKLFCDEDLITSNISNLSFNEEVLPDKVNFKKEETSQLQLIKQNSNSPIPKSQNKPLILLLTQQCNTAFNEKMNTELNKYSQNNMTQKPGDNNLFTTPHLTTHQLLNNSQNGSMISNINVPKLDLTKALRVQQISVNNQMKQDQIKQQVYTKFKQSIEKRKALLMRKQDKIISDDQFTAAILQIIGQEEDLLKELKGIMDESNSLQDELKKLRKSVEQNYVRLRQQEIQIDTLQRDLADAVERNTILIQSNLQYENKWKKVQHSLIMYKDFYQQQQSASQMNTCSTRNHNQYNTLNNNLSNLYNTNYYQSQSPHILTNSEKHNNTQNNNNITTANYNYNNNSSSQQNLQLISQINNTTTNIYNNNTLMNNTTIVQNYHNQVSMNQINNTSSINPFLPSQNAAIDLDYIQPNSYMPTSQNIQHNNQQYYQQYEQLGQKIFDEADVQNSVFVPLSLRKNITNNSNNGNSNNHEKKLYNSQSQRLLKRNNYFQQYSNHTFQNEDIQINSGGQTTLAAVPLTSNLFQNQDFTNPFSSHLQALNVFGDESQQNQQKSHSKFYSSQVRNIQEAKSKIISLAQDLYFQNGINKYAPPPQESPVKSFRKYYLKNNQNNSFIGSTNNINVNQPIKKPEKKRNFKSRSFSPEIQGSATLKTLPFRCFLKYKQIQPLRVFQTKTMSQHNHDRSNFNMFGNNNNNNNNSKHSVEQYT